MNAHRGCRGKIQTIQRTRAHTHTTFKPSSSRIQTRRKGETEAVQGAKWTENTFRHRDRGEKEEVAWVKWVCWCFLWVLTYNLNAFDDCNTVLCASIFRGVGGFVRAHSSDGREMNRQQTSNHLLNRLNYQISSLQGIYG